MALQLSRKSTICTRCAPTQLQLAHQEITDIVKISNHQPTDPIDSHNTGKASSHQPTGSRDSPDIVKISSHKPTNPTNSPDTVKISNYQTTYPTDSTHTVKISSHQPTDPQTALIQSRSPITSLQTKQRDPV